MTHYLRFPDEATFTQSCTDAGLTSEDDDGNTVIARYTHNHAMRVIGTITETVEPAEYDDEGNVTKEAVTHVVDGWHVNYKGDLPSGWCEYQISPATPKEVFAGDA